VHAVGPRPARAASEAPPLAHSRECRPHQKTHGFFEHLIRHADVLVENFAPPRLVRPLCLSTAVRSNPRLVHCSITPMASMAPTRTSRPLMTWCWRNGILGSQPGFRPPPVHVVHPLPTVGASISPRRGSLPAAGPRKTGPWP